MLSWKFYEIYKTTAGLVTAGRTGNSPDLVSAHEWPWSLFSWDRVIPQLANSFTMYWYDMPGYGRSDKSENQRTSLDVEGEVFAGMMSRWSLLRPNVVAYGFGGVTTLRAHLLHGCWSAPTEVFRPLG